MRKYILSAIGYSAFFVFSFLLSFYWTFDANHVVKPRLIDEARKQGFELDISDLDKYRLSGVEARNVTVQSSFFSTPFKIDELKARLSLLPLILGRKSVAFSAKLYDGTLTGRWVESKKNRQVNVEAKNVDLSRIQPGKVGSLWVMAKLSGKADLNLSPKTDPKKWKGQIKAGAGSGKFTAFTYHGFQVPEIKLNSMDLDVSLLSGKADIRNLELKSPDLPCDGRGTVDLATPFKSSQIQLTAKINPSAEFMAKVPALQALLPADKNVTYNGNLGAILGPKF
jgi:type II secretion system protein N